MKYTHCYPVSVISRRVWIPTLAGGLVTFLALALVLAPAPLNILRANLAFTVESASLDPVVVDGDERTHFQALIRFENLGPVRVETIHNLLFAAFSEERGILFDTRNDDSSALESGEVHTVAFDSQVTGFWDSAVLWVKVSVHDVFGSYQVMGYFWSDQPLILEI
jgi:hypothetical protein